MNLPDFVALAGLAALAVVAAPVPRVRRATLWVGHLTAALAVPTAVAAAAALQFWPGSAPADVRAVTDPWAQAVAGAVPAAAGREWLVTAALAVLVGLPVV